MSQTAPCDPDAGNNCFNDARDRAAVTMAAPGALLLAGGIAMTVIGLIAISSGTATFFLSVITVVTFGFLLMFGGAAQVVSAFWVGKWRGLLIHLLIGVFYFVVGYMIVDSPPDSLAAITLLLAAFLVVAGIFRVVIALWERFDGWGWVLLNGIISALLGVMIHEGWPQSSLFVIGLFVGIELILNGISWIVLAFSLRRPAGT